VAYASEEHEQITQSMVETSFSAGAWDTGVWDVGTWDGRILLPAENEIVGIGENIGLRLAQSSDYYFPVTFHGVLMHFTPRRQLR
jgi:hypothetical protein